MLEEVYHWVWALIVNILSLFPVVLFPVCGWRCEFSASCTCCDAFLFPLEPYVTINFLPLFCHGVLSLQWKVKVMSTLDNENSWLMPIHSVQGSKQQFKREFFFLFSLSRANSLLCPPQLDSSFILVSSTAGIFSYSGHCLIGIIFSYSLWKCPGRFLLIIISPLPETWKY